MREAIFNLYPVDICTKCKREWEAFILPNPNWKLVQAIQIKYPTSNVKEKKELEILNIDVLLELKKELEGWLMGKRNGVTL